MSNVTGQAQPVTRPAAAATARRPQRLHARNRVTVTYRQAWRHVEHAIRAAAATTRVRDRGISGDVCIYVFETLRLECDHWTGVVRDRRRRPLSGRQIADLLELPRETTARALAVLQRATVNGGALLTCTGGSWQLHTAWMSRPPQRGERSWLATDRPTWRALRKAVRAHDVAEGGGRIWHKALGAAVCLRYTCALAETGSLVLRHRGGTRALSDADVRRRFALDNTAWQMRRQLLERAGVLGPILGGMSFGFRGWDALEGLAGVVDIADYKPAYRPPPTQGVGAAEREQPAPPPRAADDAAPPVDNPRARDRVAHRSGLHTPGAAHKSRARSKGDHAREVSGLLSSFASQKVQPHPARDAPVDNSAGHHLQEEDVTEEHSTPASAGDHIERHRAVNAIIAELCAAPELNQAASAVKHSFGIRTLVSHLHDAGYTPAETRHFTFVDTPLPWPDELCAAPHRALGVLAWRLRQLREARPSTRVYRARRDHEIRCWREDLAVRKRRSAVDKERHQRNVRIYLSLPEVQRQAICAIVRETVGPAWNGAPAELDDLTACQRRHAQALDLALAAKAPRKPTSAAG